VEVEAPRLGLPGVLLGRVPQLRQALLAVERVVVQVGLGVDRQQLSRGRHHQGVQLEEAQVPLVEGPHQPRQQRRECPAGSLLQTEGEADAADLVGLQPRGRVDRDPQDRLGVPGRHLLDLHPACRGGDEGQALALPVHQQRQVELPGDGGGGLDEDPVDGLARGAGLVRHQTGAQELGGDGLQGREPRDLAYAACLAAAPGVHLRLDDPVVAAERQRGGPGLLGRGRDDALGYGDPVGGEKLLGLEFV